MNEAELRARIREFLKSGALPRTLPPTRMLEPGRPAASVEQIQVGRVAGATCTACGETDPDITYRYPADRVVRLHATCNSIWEEERRLA